MTIDRDAAIALLERAVAERGRDYVYSETNFDYSPPRAWDRLVCFYNHAPAGETPVPGCGVGLVASYLGVLGSMVEGHEASQALGEAGVKLDEAATTVFNKFQAVQDDGYSWGKALDAALDPGME